MTSNAGSRRRRPLLVLAPLTAVAVAALVQTPSSAGTPLPTYQVYAVGHNSGEPSIGYDTNADAALFTVDAGGERAPSVTVDYSGLADEFGGSYGSRLRLVRLPACALTTPDQPTCRTETPVRARNDAGTITIGT